MSFPESLVPITGEEPSLNTPALVAGEELQSPPMPACQARAVTTAGGLLLDLETSHFPQHPHSDDGVPQTFKLTS